MKYGNTQPHVTRTCWQYVPKCVHDVKGNRKPVCNLIVIGLNFHMYYIRINYRMMWILNVNSQHRDSSSLQFQNTVLFFISLSVYGSVLQKITLCVRLVKKKIQIQLYNTLAYNSTSCGNQLAVARGFAPVLV